MTITQAQVSTPAPYAELRTCPDTGSRSLHAAKDFSPGEVVAHFGARQIFNQPNYLTVQIDDSTHILLAPEFLQYINHSCDPNLFFDTNDFEEKGGVITALRPIKVGEEFSFFYPSTEWAMDRSFDCICQTKNCLGKIQGASQLPLDVVKNYKLSDYIQSKLDL